MIRRPPRSTLFPYTDALPILPTRQSRGAAGGQPAFTAAKQPSTGAQLRSAGNRVPRRSEEHTSELQSRQYLVCRLLLEKKKNTQQSTRSSTTQEAET